MSAYQSVLNFWFEEIEPKQHWVNDLAFDQLIAERFGELHHQAILGELFEWRLTPGGRLAEIIILDQFSRNMFRDTPRSFSYDVHALVLAQEAVALGLDAELPTEQRTFLYMPYMHSESLLIHEEAVKLFARNGVKENLDFEYRHKVIIESFGRYPHRNAILGRESSPEEVAFLNEPGSSF